MSALHWEALRKQRVIDKKHHQVLEEKKQKAAEQKLEDERLKFEKTNTANSYQRELASSRSGNSQKTPHCHHNQDAERRLYSRDRCKMDYNAKMSARYNDLNFSQQW
ncbi:uncharacterized protein LOC117113309 [Anneissia japonica]|uniref:uncharacterized protein LOC117113309 n=1 Tax=Anneissia japonica TaxID=1529436 RepID=UPI0014259380|nr:uncharacterized protein LOC117113309 [Anneissia japonica]